ncbi:phage infection protein [Paenibacillus agaridevorans]|uniref:Phage infection protein n=1 Tax=Paenibacillus agaridevorans TaxID=171404 RepID=A0A2R5ESF2_9BACL|nr:ABC transporter permease [Paenibacillus agaridevorans]GBG09055.1 phage infection protein [Paenibacillus agaridevorans]
MQVFKNKLLLALPLIAILVLFIFVLALYPSATMKPVLLPIAIVNLDEGAALPDGTAVNMGDQLVEQMKQASGKAAEGEASPVKWVQLESAEAAREGMDNRDYYGAMIIAADFSAKQASLRSPAPQQPEIEVLVNQGMNATAANMVTQMVSGMVGKLNATISAGLLHELEASGATLKPSQAAIVASPILAQITNVNETGANAARGNAPVSLFQPIWMASIAGAAISTLVVGKAAASASSRRSKLAARLTQAGVGVVLALLSGFLVTWLADRFLDLDVPSMAEMGLFISFSILAFFLMISAILSWTGIRGIVLFVLLLFFGAPLLALPAEFMNGFYRDWIHSWLPMRFMVDGLRELFFFGNGFEWNEPTAALFWISAGSLILLLLSVLKPQKASSGAEGAASASS